MTTSGVGPIRRLGHSSVAAADGGAGGCGAGRGAEHATSTVTRRPRTRRSLALVPSGRLSSFDDTALAHTLANIDPTATIRPPSLQDTVAHPRESVVVAAKL